MTMLGRVADAGPPVLAVLALLVSGGCTSTDASLGVGPAVVPDAGAAMPSGDPASPPSRALLGPVQFLPVVGAPPNTVASLSKALSDSAAANGIAIAPSEGPAAPLRLKGYLSALDEGSRTVVVYVWDVVDPAGNRVSRIQGQERIAGTAADPWSNVGDAALQAIASRTMAEIRRTAPASGRAG